MSLIDRWELQIEGSDFFPGLDLLPNVPAVLKLNGDSKVESFKIERIKQLDVEEIILTFQNKDVTIIKNYQIGTINVEELDSSLTNIILATVQDVNDDFTRFTIVRMGPKVHDSRYLS